MRFYFFLGRDDSNVLLAEERISRKTLLILQTIRLSRNLCQGYNAISIIYIASCLHVCVTYLVFQVTIYKIQKVPRVTETN